VIATGRRAVVVLALAGCVAASAGCGDATSPAHPDLSSPASIACATGQAPLSSFIGDGVFACRATYAAERTARQCALVGFDVATCGTLDVVQSGSVASTLDCYYDHVSGALVDAWSFDDTEGSCAAGSAHDTCVPATFTDLCAADGGA